MPDVRLIERVHQGLVNFWEIHGVLGFKETKFSSSIHRRSQVYCCWIQLCIITLDEANFEGLWLQTEQSPSPMWKWECNPHGGQSCWTQPHKAHRHPVSLSKRSQQRGDIAINYVSTHNQLADIFTKLLDEKTFSKLRNELNVLDSRKFDWNLAHIAHFIPLIMTCLFHLVQMHITYSSCAKANTNVLPSVFLYLFLDW
jgi:hypothetical protein